MTTPIYTALLRPCACLPVYVLPAIHAVIKHATVPVISALIATLAKSPLRSGASGDSPPSWIPIEPILANPQQAYVAITSDRFYYKKKKKKKRKRKKEKEKKNMVCSVIFPQNCQIQCSKIKISKPPKIFTDCYVLNTRSLHQRIGQCIFTFC